MLLLNTIPTSTEEPKVQINDDIGLDEEFEYHDGLGDLLREKERREFSWVKFIIVVISTVTVITLSFMVIVAIGRNLMIRSPQTKPLMESNNDKYDFDPDKPVFVDDPIRQRARPKPVKKTAVAPAKKVTTKPISRKTKAITTTKKTTKNRTLYRVTFGPFDTASQAHAMVKTLKGKKVSSYVWRLKENGQTQHRVQAGAFRTKKRALTLVSQLKRKGLNASIVHK
ncbi:SPOR domain-containing protein [bacterium]|nr:SPOR domain-containing protein [bacterium]